MFKQQDGMCMVKQLWQNDKMTPHLLQVQGSRRYKMFKLQDDDGNGDGDADENEDRLTARGGEEAEQPRGRISWTHICHK